MTKSVINDQQIKGPFGLQEVNQDDGGSRDRIRENNPYHGDIDSIDAPRILLWVAHFIYNGLKTDT